MELKFKGYDWTEILPLFAGMEGEYENLGHPFFDAETKFADNLKKIIKEYPQNNTPEKTNELVSQLKMFLTELFKHFRTLAGVIQINGITYGQYEILKEKNEKEFLDWFADNLTDLWS